MTSNIDRTAEVIADALRPALSIADGIGRDLARILADAGLLAPDTLEYGVADANEDEDIVWFPVDTTVGTAEDARQAAVNYAASDQFFRLVCRRVSAPWEVTDE